MNQGHHDPYWLTRMHEPSDLFFPQRDRLLDAVLTKLRRFFDRQLAAHVSTERLCLLSNRDVGRLSGVRNFDAFLATQLLPLAPFSSNQGEVDNESLFSHGGEGVRLLKPHGSLPECESVSETEAQPFLFLELPEFSVQLVPQASREVGDAVLESDADFERHLDFLTQCKSSLRKLARDIGHLLDARVRTLWTLLRRCARTMGVSEPQGHWRAARRLPNRGQLADESFKRRNGRLEVASGCFSSGGYHAEESIQRRCVNFQRELSKPRVETLDDGQGGTAPTSRCRMGRCREDHSSASAHRTLGR
jgi:hypothetical protein